MILTTQIVVHCRKTENSLKTVIQHKIRPLLKCYTVFNFDLNKEDQTFTFQKSHKQRHSPIRMDDPYIYKGKYTIAPHPFKVDQCCINVEIDTNIFDKIKNENGSNIRISKSV